MAVENTRRLASGVARWLRWSSMQPQRWWIVCGVAVVAVGLVVRGLWPQSHAEAPRARQYLAFTACLLTDDKGIGGPAARPVWAGMQDASLATHAKVQFLEVSGEQTAANAATFVASLAQSHCDLVFATGQAPVAAVRDSATSFPNVRFYLVEEPNPHGNLSGVEGGAADRTRGAVAKTVTDAAKGQR
jgi:basic membrane lipoprotein Med (substrate-binding protein (PBP1-ABC) superfamily)